MSFTYNSVANQVASLLGNIKGYDPATAQTNYAATQSTSTLKGPDFTPGMIQDAILNTLCEIVETIAANPFHLERLRYAENISGVTNGSTLPLTGPSGQRILGVPGQVVDITGNPMKPLPLDKVIGFTRFVASVYAGKFDYSYCWIGRTMYNTGGASVTVVVCCFDRPAFVAGSNVPLADYLEEGLVMGTVARLAGKENMFIDLWTGADRTYQACLENIRRYSDPLPQTAGLAAPSMT